MNLAALSLNERVAIYWAEDFLKKTIALDAFWNAQHSTNTEVLKLVGGNIDHVMDPLVNAIKAHGYSIK